MATIDIYKQYFSADCVFNEVARRGACVWLTADSCSGIIRYEVGVSFFPHRDEADFAVSYDACGLKELMNTQGRRSKKRDAKCMGQLHAAADEISASLGGKIHWDQPLREAQYE